MRPLLLAALLLSPALPAFAEDPPASESAAAPAPLTVLLHELSVSASGGRTTVTQTWSVRVEDPNTLTAGVAAPPGMDGATSGKARILGDLAMFPAGTAVGDTFKFVHTERLGRYASGTFTPVEDLPADAVRAQLNASGVPLTLWADPAAEVDLTGGSGRVSWEGTGAKRLVWSTWPSWAVAGRTLDAAIADKLAPAHELGRDIAEGLEGMGPSAIVRRVNRQVKRIPEAGSWSTCRRASEVARSGEGNDAERALLIFNLLQLSGKEVQPAMVAAAGQTQGVPSSLVVPHLFTETAVAIVDDGPRVVIDPASPHVLPPDVPSRLRGGQVWVKGDPPVELGTRGLVDGHATLSGQLVMSDDGTASWTLSMTADGTAAEVIRERLGSDVDEEQRNAVLQGLASVAFPDIQRFTVAASGLTDLDRPLRIEMTGYVKSTLTGMGPGMIGEIHPLMAPALAAWLPGRIEVVEQVSVRRPKHVLPLSVQLTQKSHSPEASIASSIRVEGERLVLDSRVSRPDTSHRPAAEARAETLLHERAHEGARVYFFPWPTAEVKAAMKDGIEGLTPLEVHMLEALAWWREPEEAKARKAMKKAMKLGSVEEIAAAIVRFGDPSNVLPWEALLEESPPEDRMACARGMEAQGQRDLAWRKAIALADYSDPRVQLDAKLVMARTQPKQQPSLEADREGHLAWRPSGELLAEVQELAAAQSNQEASAEALLALAELHLDAGELEEGEQALEKRLAMGSTPGLLAMRAEVRAQRGASPVEVQRILDEAGALDDIGAIHAAHALTLSGDRRGALAWTQVAARLRPKDPTTWDLVVEAALDVGDLARAVEAARLASDAAPEDRDRARRHSHLASLAWDRAQAQLAAKRAGLKASDIPWAEDVDGLRELADPAELWATLAFHDSATIASPTALLARGRAALASGDAAAAARDGSLLLSHHQDPRGAALAFAGSVGRVYGTGPRRLLDEAVDTSAEARRARMEYQLLHGEDPSADAAKLTDDPQAAALAEFLRTGTAEGWTDGGDPSLSVRGFASASALGKARGVAAVTDRGRGLTLMRHTGAEWLAPPLSLLYTADARPVSTTADGDPVYPLSGGALPVFAAVHSEEGLHTLGLGHTPEAAQRALDAIP
ncbi:MAG: hypothetical protein EP330_18430 [Deltaproteobacteria bacterium]|nr:MAG: hypothetical protein EP330_18430 [Deltaproteobacteria bacterium]